MGIRIYCIFGTLALLLSGCISEMVISSNIAVKRTGREEEMLRRLVPDIVETASNSGGKCTVNESKLRVICRYNWDNGIYASVSAGESQNSGEVTFTVRTSVASIFPKSKKSILLGKNLPAFHREWEQWALEKFSSDVLSLSSRNYIGFDIEQEILP